MSSDAKARFWLSTPLMFLGACHSPSSRSGPEDCAPTTAELPATSSAEGLVGEYHLRLIATSGAKQGAVAEGSLKLQSQDSSLRYRARLGGTQDSTVLHPLFGAADLDLTPIDAVVVGSTTSLDPMQPGVLVMERHAAPGQAPRAEITMRLGSDANRRDRIRFDGGYTVLRVKQISPGRLAGTWASGVTRERSSGYFCAVRR